MNYFTCLESDVEKFLKHHKDENFFVQPKLDGEDVIAVRTVNGEVYAFNRYNRVYKSLPFLQFLPKTAIVLRGEMHVENGSVYDLKKTITYKPDLIVYTVHDILYYDNEELVREPYCRRLEILNRVFTKMTLSEAIYSKIKVIKNNIVPRENILLQFNVMVEQGYEGIVVKPIESTYTDNMWLKIKKKITYDVILTAVKLDKRYKPMQSFRIEDYNGRYLGDVSSGLTLEQKLYIISLATNNIIEEEGNRYALLSKPILVEIEAQEMLKSGKFRHPKILRIRDDKPISEKKEVII